MIADYQLDVWRMATSIVLIARENGLSDDVAQAAVEAFAESYLDRVAEVRGNDDEIGSEHDLEDAYGRLDELLEEVIAEEGRDHLLSRWTVLTEEGRSFDLADDELAPVDETLRAEVIDAMPSYGETLDGGLDYDEPYFEVLDVVQRRGAGVGSLGTPRYYVLLEGPSEDHDDDVVLDVKRQGTPTAYAFLGERERVRNDTAFVAPAERVVLAQRALLTDVDDHLGWIRLGDASFSVRERTPHREGFPLEELDSETRLVKLSEQWGVILGTDHARADRDFSEQLVPTSFDREVDERTDGDHAGFRELAWNVARVQADRTAGDYAVFLELLGR